MPSQTKKLLIKNKAVTTLATAIALTVGASINDFQKVGVYQVPNSIKHGNPTLLIDREFDRLEKKIPNNATKISEINQSQPYLKIILAGLAVAVSGVALKLTIEEEKETPLTEYKQAIEQDKRKADIDFDRAIYDQKLKMDNEIRVLELHEEFYSNPIAMAILNDKDNVENGLTGEEGEEENEENNNDVFNDVFNDEKSPYREWFTPGQITKICRSMDDGKKLTDCVEEYTPGYSSSHAQWAEIKEELVVKIKEFRQNEKR